MATRIGSASRRYIQTSERRKRGDGPRNPGQESCANEREAKQIGRAHRWSQSRHRGRLRTPSKLTSEEDRESAGKVDDRRGRAGAAGRRSTHSSPVDAADPEQDRGHERRQVGNLPVVDLLPRKDLLGRPREAAVVVIPELNMARTAEGGEQSRRQMQGGSPAAPSFRLTCAGQRGQRWR